MLAPNEGVACFCPVRAVEIVYGVFLCEAQ